MSTYVNAAWIATMAKTQDTRFTKSMGYGSVVMQDARDVVIY
jgi:hypothetical protein